MEDMSAGYYFIWFCFLHVDIQLFQHNLFEEYPSPLNCLCILVKNKLLSANVSLFLDSYFTSFDLCSLNLCLCSLFFKLLDNRIILSSSQLVSLQLMGYLYKTWTWKIKVVHFIYLYLLLGILDKICILSQN